MFQNERPPHSTENHHSFWSQIDENIQDIPFSRVYLYRGFSSSDHSTKRNRKLLLAFTKICNLQGLFFIGLPSSGFHVFSKDLSLASSLSVVLFCRNPRWTFGLLLGVSTSCWICDLLFFFNHFFHVKTRWSISTNLIRQAATTFDGLNQHNQNGCCELVIPACFHVESP